LKILLAWSPAAYIIRTNINATEKVEWSATYWIHPEDGGSKLLRNVGILPQHHTMSEPRRQRLECKRNDTQDLHYQPPVTAPWRYMSYPRRQRLESSPPSAPQILQQFTTCGNSSEVFLSPVSSSHESALFVCLSV
jgi:hypothetical protein